MTKKPTSKLLALMLFFILCIGTHTSVQGQFIDIPDANFRDQLQRSYPACFGGVGGIQLNSACPAVTSATELYVSSDRVVSLIGVTAFTNLQILVCVASRLTTLPNLPATLRYLDCRFNELKSFTNLPASLQILHCSSNQLTSLPSLPPNLQILNCGINKITSLPPLPTSLQELACYQNKLAILPPLPAGLLFLHCGNNLLTNLPPLPAGLRVLTFETNLITTLPVLPTSLYTFSCVYNYLDFADLEAVNLKPDYYLADIQRYTIVGMLTNGTLTIDGTIGGTQNVYKWYKDDVLIAGANTPVFTKTGFTSADAGIYRCAVTSTFVGIGTTTGVTINSSNITVTLTSICPTIIFKDNFAPYGMVGMEYSADIDVRGNTAPLSYAVSPALPEGLSLNTTTGIISGTPTTQTPLTSYTVTVTQTAACFAIGVYKFLIRENPTTAIDNPLSNTVKVYPNPSKGIFTVDFEGLNLVKSVLSIYDSQGKTVYLSEINSNESVISLENMPAGLYLLQINTTKGRILKRLVKE